MASNSLPAQTLLEGLIKYRHNKKWKSRWAVVSKLSPIADCLSVSLYRNYREKIKSNPPKTRITLEGYVGIESCFVLDKESNTLAIICKSLTVIFSFDTREILHQWQLKFQENFCKEKHYLVHLISIPPKSKLTCGPARLLLQDFGFGLVTGIPPRLLDYWALEQLRRFGNVDGKLCFEGGSKCGKGTGLHILYSNESAEISKFFELASNGQLNLILEQPNVNEKYFSITNNEFLYNSKYQNVTNDNVGGREQKSMGSDCSTCDSCSQILNLSTLDDNSPSSDTYLSQSRTTCGFYHSSINLNCKDSSKSHYGGSSECKPCSNQYSHKPKEVSVLTASHHCSCQSTPSQSMFNASTISRSSNIKCDLGNGVPQHQTHCHQHHPHPHFSVTSINRCPSDVQHQPPASSPSTCSLAHCPISSDRESLFSQSSHGSSNSSSGCSTNSSSVTFNGTSQFINQHSNLCNGICYAKHKSRQHYCSNSDEPEQKNCKSISQNDNNSISQCYLAQSQEDVNQDVFISDDCCSCNREAYNGKPPQTDPLMSPQQTFVQQPAEQMAGHLYSQINFMNRNDIGTRHTNPNYDIPKKMMMLRAESQNKLPINHCNWDKKQLNADIGQQSSNSCCHRTTCDYGKDKFNSITMAASDKLSDKSTLFNSFGRDNESIPLRCTGNGQMCCKRDDNIAEQEPNGEHLYTLRPNRHASNTTQPNSQVHKRCSAFKLEHNYENMHFINTIDLYENMCFATSNVHGLNGCSKCNLNESVQEDKKCMHTIQDKNSLNLFETASVQNSDVKRASDCRNNNCDLNGETKCHEELLGTIVRESTCQWKEDEMDLNGTCNAKSMDRTGNCLANNNNWTNIGKGDGTTSESDSSDITSGQQACLQGDPIYLQRKLHSRVGLNEHVLQRENNSLLDCTNRSTKLLANALLTDYDEQEEEEEGEEKEEREEEDGDDNDSLSENNDCDGNDNAHCIAQHPKQAASSENQPKLTVSLLSLNNRVNDAHPSAESGVVAGETKNYQMKIQTMDSAKEAKSSVTNLISCTKQVEYDCRKSAMLRERSYSIDDISRIENCKLNSNMMMMINIYGSSDNESSVLCSSSNRTAAIGTTKKLGHYQCGHYRNNHTHKSDQLLNVIKHNPNQIFEWIDNGAKCSTESEEEEEEEDFCTSSQNTIFCQNAS